MVSRKLRFAIFGNTYQPKKSVSVQKLLACLTQRQAEVCIEREFYEFLTAGQRLPIDNVQVIEGDATEVLREKIRDLMGDRTKPDAVFIGGSGGELRDIISIISEMGTGIHFVINVYIDTHIR